MPPRDAEITDTASVRADASAGSASALVTADADGRAGLAIQRRRHHGQLYVAIGIIAVIVVISLIAPLIAPYSPNAQNFAQRYLPPFHSPHWLGTDEEGRDVLSRLLYGGRATLGLSILAVTLAVAIGTVLGLTAGFSARAWVTTAIMRLVDLMLAFPVIMVALSLAETIGSGSEVVVLAIIFASVPYVTRIIFGETKRERNREYVEAARALGAGQAAVLLREVLPNIRTTVIVYWSSLVGIGTVFAAGLSAIGIGVQEPTADWGKMMAEGSQVLLTGSPWQAIIPGLMILIVGLSFNWLGDGLRDVLDPHSVSA